MDESGIYTVYFQCGDKSSNALLWLWRCLQVIMVDEVRLAVREGGTRHHVLSTGRMLSVADVQTNPLCDHDVYRLQGYDIRSLLIGPVLDVEGKVIGLVELVNKDPARLD